MFKELLLDEVGQRLAKQPFQGFFWQQWVNYIQVSPCLSETYPLWKLENHVLKNELSLFGVKPQELEQQISAYRQRSWLVRCWLRLFTRINTKIAVWSYYRQCLSFQALLQGQALSAPQEREFPVDFTMIEALLPYLRQAIYQFEKMIDQQLRNFEVNEGKFLWRYQDYVRKQEAIFFKLLEKELKGSSRAPKTLLRNTLKEEYRDMREMMKKFTKSCLKGVRQMKNQLSPFMPNLMLPVVKSEILYAEEDSPSSDIPRLASSCLAKTLPSPRLEDINEIEVLMKQQRKAVKRLLAQEDSLDKETEIELFLEDSFQKIRHLIKSRLGKHQALVDALQSGRLKYRQASQQSKDLQKQLEPLFKKKVFLLFHPDKYDATSESLKQILHALFIQIKNLYKTSLDQLLKEIEIIQQSNDEEEDDEERLHAYRAFCREFLKDFTAVYAKYEHEVKTIYAEMKVQLKEHHAVIKEHHAVIKEKYAEMEARIGADRDEVNVRLQEMERLFRARMALPHNQATEPDNETAGTSYSFFQAGR